MTIIYNQRDARKYGEDGDVFKTEDGLTIQRQDGQLFYMGSGVIVDTTFDCMRVELVAHLNEGVEPGRVLTQGEARELPVDTILKVEDFNYYMQVCSEGELWYINGGPVAEVCRDFNLEHTNVCIVAHLNEGEETSGYQPGDMVTIIEGPYSSYAGNVLRVDPNLESPYLVRAVGTIGYGRYAKEELESRDDGLLRELYVLGGERVRSRLTGCTYAADKPFFPAGRWEFLMPERHKSQVGQTMTLRKAISYMPNGTVVKFTEHGTNSHVEIHDGGATWVWQHGQANYTGDHCALFDWEVEVVALLGDASEGTITHKEENMPGDRYCSPFEGFENIVTTEAQLDAILADGKQRDLRYVSRAGNSIYGGGHVSEDSVDNVNALREKVPAGSHWSWMLSYGEPIREPEVKPEIESEFKAGDRVRFMYDTATPGESTGTVIGVLENGNVNVDWDGLFYNHDYPASKLQLIERKPEPATSHSGDDLDCDEYLVEVPSGVYNDHTDGEWIYVATNNSRGAYVPIDQVEEIIAATKAKYGKR